MSDVTENMPAADGGAGAGDSAEQRAELAALAALAGGDGAGHPGSEMANQPGAVAAPAVDAGEDVAALLQIGIGIIGTVFPSVKAVWTKEAFAEVGATVGAVCEKRGWLTGGIGEYREEIACAMAVAPLAFATYGAVKVDLAARKALETPDAAGALVSGPGAEPEGAAVDLATRMQQAAA